MASSVSRDLFDVDDHVLAHHYIRRFGRRPSARDLAHYRTTKSRFRDRLRSRVRRGAGLLITRL